MDQQQRHSKGSPGDLGGVPSRRHLLCALAGAGLGWGAGRLPDVAEAKKKRRKKKKKRRPNQDQDQEPIGPLCTGAGEPCTDPGFDCQERFCLRDSFAVEAIWMESGSNHQTVLFVPPAGGATGPFPYINSDCNPGNSTCAVAYPFACVDRNATGPGNEVTTVYDRLPGTYAYRMLLDSPVPAGELTVVLTDRGGRVVRTWTNPASAPKGFVGWHVFDVDADGRVASVDATRAINGDPDVCPYAALGRQDRDRAKSEATRDRSTPVKESGKS